MSSKAENTKLYRELSASKGFVPPQKNLCVDQLKGACESTDCSNEHVNESRLGAAVRFNEITGSTRVCAYGSNCTGACVKSGPPRFHLEASPNVDENQQHHRAENQQHHRAETQQHHRAETQRAETQHQTPKQQRAAAREAKKLTKAKAVLSKVGVTVAAVPVTPQDPLRLAFNDIQKQKNSRIEYFFNLRKITLNDIQRAAATKIIEEMIAKETEMFNELSALASTV